MKKLISLLILLCSLAAMGQTTKPLPGIEVNLAPVSGGINQTMTTDNNGVVSFNNLSQGKYTISFVKKINKNTAAQKAYRFGSGADSIIAMENHNSSRSNKTYPIMKDGTTGVNVTVTLLWNGSSNKTPDPPIEVEIGPNGGTITCQFKSEIASGVGIKEEGVKRN